MFPADPLLFQEDYPRLYRRNERLEIHEDAIVSGQRVIIVDDVLASGGTMSAAVNLLKKCDAEIVSCFVVIELTEFSARNKLDSINLLSLVKY